MRGTFLGALFVVLAVAAPAAAQTRPGPSPPHMRERLADVASPRAGMLYDDEGRVRRAWSLDIALVGGSPEASARAFVDRFAGALAIAPGALLRVDRVVSTHGFTIVRFVRTALGGDVLGSSLVVRFAADGALDYVGAAGLATPLSPSSRTIDRAMAERIAQRHLPSARILDIAPAALPLDGHLVPVWRADLAGALLSDRTRVVVDAETGAVLLAHSLVVDALGRVYAANPVSDDGTTSDVELSFLTSRDHLTGRYFRVSSCNAGDRGCDPAQLAIADADGNFLHDPSEPSFDDPFAEVQAYYHLDRVARYFREAHAFTWTCGEQTMMEAFVNYAEAAGAPYENAAFVPSSGRECGFIFFGQGATRDFAYDADVVYHEATHAVVDGAAGLGFYALDALGVSYEPGAINEGTADYFAATLAGDPALAEYFASSPGAGEGALRRLDNALSCPADLVGEPHYDGRIWAALGWDARAAIGAERADALMFVTLASMEDTPSLADAAEVLVATASTMRDEGTLTDDELTTIDALVDARGLRGCERIAPLDGGAVRTGYSGHPMLTGAFGGSLAPVHYRIEVPPNATRLSLEIARSTLAGRYHVYGRTGSPVRFAGTRRPPVIATLDLAPDASGRVVLERDGDPPLPRCETVYFAIATEDLESAGASLFTVTAELETSGSMEACPAPDAGAQGDAGTDGGPPLEALYAPGGGGCGCHAARPAARCPAWAMALVLLALSRRRVGVRESRR